MEMEEERDYLYPDELVAIQALVELARVNETDNFVTWRRKRRRTRGVYSSCNSGGATTAPPAATAAPPSVKPAPPVATIAPVPRPCDGPLKLKMEKKLGVQKPPIAKGPKKKTLAELKELSIRLSSDREEMEKLALKLSTKGEPQLLLASLDSREGDALEYSKNHDTNWVGKYLRHDLLASTKSSSHTFALSNLNIHAEDVEDLCENQIVQTDSRVIIAAEARKYRMECLRFKHSQVKVRIR